MESDLACPLTGTCAARDEGRLRCKPTLHRLIFLLAEPERFSECKSTTSTDSFKAYASWRTT